MRLESGDDPQPYGFTGEPWAAGVGLAYHRARWLEPSMGRFVSMDPFAGFSHLPARLHKYSYAGASPGTLSDPSGLTSYASTLAAAGIAGVVTAIAAPLISSTLGHSLTVVQTVEAALAAVAFTLLAGASPFLAIAIASFGLAATLTFWFEVLARPGVSTAKKQLVTGLLVLTSFAFMHSASAFGTTARGTSSTSASRSTSRVDQLLNEGPGLNVTPRSTALRYRVIGRGKRTFVTDRKAIEDVIGPIRGNRVKITEGQARRLEYELGLRPNSLESINVISIIDDVSARSPASPITGNDFFLEGGSGLPGGGPELTIQGIPSAGGPGIRQVILEVSR